MRAFSLALLVTLMACHAAVPDSGVTPAGARPTVLLVMIDGFRYDYLDRYPSPNLHRIIAQGVRAPLVSEFPTKTFPNHYSIVTGLFPEHHGIVDNTMYDPSFDAEFRINDSAAVTDGRWWGGEPLWVTAERQGQLTAPFFWPGSEAVIEGIRPHYRLHYRAAMPDSARVRQVLEWLTLPADRRPTFVTLYFSEVDHAGHDAGPDSPAVAAAVLHVDSAIGALLDGLVAHRFTDHVNVIVVADHGMAAISLDSVVAIDDFLSLDALAHVSGGNPELGLWPRPGLEDSVVRSLRGRNPHLDVWRRDSIPARLHYRANRRIPPVLALAHIGWSLTLRRGDMASHPDRFRGGEHGYDDTLSVMRATFLAEGPAFRQGYAAEAFRNIHLYDLMAGILGLTPAPNDGSRDSTAMLLRETRAPQ
jgi:predicted AlkP superfamily pyrophosphatase or phosphodiesterase